MNFEMKIASIPLKEIEYKEKHPVRHESRAKKYAKMIKAGHKFKPIMVFGKRHRGDTYQVFDGHARVLASRFLGRKTIRAEITLVDRKGRTKVKK